MMLCATLLLVASASESIAQDADEPLRLIPAHQNEADDDGSEPGGADNTVSDAELGAEVEQVAAPESSASESAEPGIQVGSLEAIDPDAAGVLLPGIEPFSGDFWSGSRRSRIEALLPRLPAAAPSDTMRRLALSLLTSPAQPPAGPGEAGALVLARGGRLVAMGARDAALALLESAGLESGPALSARIENDRHLAALDLDAACEQILGKAGRAGDGYWRRVRILCQANAGLIEAATLGLELLLETDAAPDQAFDDTIYAMAGLAEPVVDPLADPTPLRVAAWRLAQFPISAQAVARAAPDVLPAIVGAPESLQGPRLLAAERAEAAGTLTIETLRDLYRAMAFSPDERADALEQVESLEPTLGRSLMFQAIEEQTALALRAELLAAALSLAEAQGAHGTTARALAHLVRTVPPAPEHGWFSGAAGRALMAAGDYDAAAAWYALASEEAPRDAETARSAVRLWPLMLLGAQEIYLKTAPFETWLALRVDEGEGAVALARANWLAILADALGGQIDPEVWDRLMLDERPVAARAPALALANGLQKAAEGAQLGETVLLALLLLGENGPAAAGIATVGPVVSSLASAGLQEEARAIALEAALAAGL
ncbi:MAG: hypothetical protein OXB97_05340 [Rhodospirillales bacterium]|nr:hypothetical protein [Rhodospirillales bacterium]